MILHGGAIRIVIERAGKGIGRVPLRPLVRNGGRRLLLDRGGVDLCRLERVGADVVIDRHGALLMK
jgi:hypothetical protein